MEDTETRLEQLFFQACEIAGPEAQAAFLKEACPDDELLRINVTRLLIAHRQAGHFLNGGSRADEAADRDWEAGIGADAGPQGRIGNYQLVKLIGEGTFSRVYLAKQESPVRRCVAVKIVKAGMDTLEVVRRFRREREVLALMSHPGIARIFDAGATPNGRPYFAMEWVQGTEITRYCDHHRLSVPQRLRLFCDVCLAVLHAHQKGVIHRDLKPSNILVSENDGHPWPKVIDFGIVKVLREVASGTSAGTLGASPVGTPTYMSPEQAQLGSADVDTRSDIYSLGALLYELLAGQPPFDRRRLVGVTWEDVATMIRAQDPVRLSVRMRRLAAAEVEGIAAARQSTPHALRRLLEGDLDWIVLKALEKDRDERYQSAAELVADIRNHLEDRPVSAAAPSPVYRLRKMVGRNRHAVAVAGLIAACLLAGVVVSSRLAVLARSRAVEAKDSQAHAELAEHEARRRLIEAYVAAGLTANERADHDHAMLWFAHAALAGGEGSRDRAVNLLRARNWLERNSLPVAAFRVPAELRELRFAPRGDQLMTLGAGREFDLWDVREGASVPWAREAGPVAAVAWSPDGAQVALALAGGGVEVRRASDGGVVQSLSLATPATALAFSPDGRHLAHGARRIVLWDLQDEVAAAEWVHPDDVSEIVFGPGGARIATACADGLARVFELSAGPGRFEILGRPMDHLPAIRLDVCKNKTSYHANFLSGAYGSALAFLDAGRVLATRSDTYEITFRDISSGEVVRRFDHICCSSNFRVSADGTAMACGMQGNVVGVWDTRSGWPLGAMLPQGGCVFDVAFSPRGDLLLTAGADHNATFWSLQDGVRVGPRLHHFSDVMSVAYSADGRLVAAVQADGLARVWVVPGSGLASGPVGDDFGPERVRLGGQGRLVVASREPAWRTDFRRTRVYEVDGGAPAGPVMEFPACVQDAAVSGDGQFLAVALCDPDAGSVASLQIHEVASGQRLLRSSDLPSAPMSLVWHPTASRVGVVCQDGEVGVARVEPDLPIDWLRREAPAGDQSRFQVAFTPAGRRLMALGPGGKVEIWRPDEGPQSRSEISATAGGIWSFAVSGSGGYLATATVLGAVEVWDLKTLRRAGPVLTHPGWVYQASFSADESSLVTACHDGSARVWEWRAGKLRCQPLHHAEQVLDAVFTPDDRWVLTACGDGAVRVWDPQGGEIIMPPVQVGSQALGMAVPPDGRQVVVGSVGGPIQVLSLPGRDDAAGLDPEDLCALGEVLSNGEIREGRRRDFTAPEWLKRFEQYQRARPAGLPGLLPEDRGLELPVIVDPLTSCGQSPSCQGCEAWQSVEQEPAAAPEVVR